MFIECSRSWVGGGGDGLKKGQLAQFAKILAHFVGDYMEKSHHHVP